MWAATLRKHCTYECVEQTNIVCWLFSHDERQRSLAIPTLQCFRTTWMQILNFNAWLRCLAEGLTPTHTLTEMRNWYTNAQKHSCRVRWLKTWHIQELNGTLMFQEVSSIFAFTPANPWWPIFSVTTSPVIRNSWLLPHIFFEDLQLFVQNNWQQGNWSALTQRSNDIGSVFSKQQNWTCSSRL